MINAVDDMPSHWAFYFQGSGLPLSFSRTWSGVMCNFNVVLQEPQAVTLIVHRMAFHLYSKLVASHLNNSSAKAYLHNKGGTVCFSFQNSLLHIECGQQHSITYIPA